MIDRKLLIDKSKEMCRLQDCELLYLTFSGSHLYGTSTETSDIDLSGIFLPSKNRLLIGENTTYIKYESKKDIDNYFNTDVEIKLFSLQFFLKDLVLKCDTNSLDLIYSYLTKSNVLYNKIMYNTNDRVEYYIMDEILHNVNRLFEIPDVMNFSYINFAITQAERYGVKGNRLRLAKQVLEYLDSLDINLEGERLLQHVKPISAYVGKNEFLIITPKPYPGYLELLNKKHMLTITLEEFYDRVKRKVKEYGERAQQAEIDDGKDWKALSHSLRAILQMEQLCKIGYIKFPLDDANTLRDIKLGKYSKKEVDYLIHNGLSRLKKLDNKFKGKRDENYVDRIILDAYNC